MRTAALAAVASSLTLLAGPASAAPKCLSYEQKLLGVSRDGRYAAFSSTFSHGGTQVFLRDLTDPGPAPIVGGEVRVPYGGDVTELPLDFGKLSVVRPPGWSEKDVLAGSPMAQALRARCGAEIARRALEPHRVAADDSPLEPARALFGTSYVVLVYELLAEDCDSTSGEDARALPCGSKGAAEQAADAEVLGAGDWRAALGAIAERVWRGKRDPARALSLVNRLPRADDREQHLTILSDTTLYLSQLGPLGARSCVAGIRLAREHAASFEKDPRVRDAILHNLRKCEALLPSGEEGGR
jgi:hypothetical protein